MRSLKLAVIILIGLLLLSNSCPTAVSAEPFVMKFGLAAPDLDPKPDKERTKHGDIGLLSDIIANSI